MELLSPYMLPSITDRRFFHPGYKLRIHLVLVKAEWRGTSFKLFAESILSYM